MNSISASMLSSGNLWLELSVGGERLTPRMPVASVPYARVAQDLRGGSVDATSVSVGGIQVVDSDGRFTGPLDNIVAEVVSAAQSAGPDAISLNAATLGGQPAGAYLTRDEYQTTNLDNMLNNAGFERFPSGADTFPEWWTLLGDNDGNTTATRETEFHDGTYSMGVRDASTVRRFCAKQVVHADGALPLTARAVGRSVGDRAISFLQTCRRSRPRRTLSRSSSS